MSNPPLARGPGPRSPDRSQHYDRPRPRPSRHRSPPRYVPPYIPVPVPVQANPTPPPSPPPVSPDPTPVNPIPPSDVPRSSSHINLNPWIVAAIAGFLFAFFIGLAIWSTKQRYRALDEAIKTNNPALAAAIMQPTPTVVTGNVPYGYPYPNYYPTANVVI